MAAPASRMDQPAFLQSFSAVPELPQLPAYKEKGIMSPSAHIHHVHGGGGASSTALKGLTFPTAVPPSGSRKRKSIGHPPVTPHEGGSGYAPFTGGAVGGKREGGGGSSSTGEGDTAQTTGQDDEEMDEDEDYFTDDEDRDQEMKLLKLIQQMKDVKASRDKKKKLEDLQSKATNSSLSFKKWGSTKVEAIKQQREAKVAELKEALEALAGEIRTEMTEYVSKNDAHLEVAKQTLHAVQQNCETLRKMADDSVLKARLEAVNAQAAAGKDHMITQVEAVVAELEIIVEDIELEGPNDGLTTIFAQLAG